VGALLSLFCISTVEFIRSFIHSQLEKEENIFSGLTSFLMGTEKEEKLCPERR